VIPAAVHSSEKAIAPNSSCAASAGNDEKWELSKKAGLICRYFDQQRGIGAAGQGSGNQLKGVLT